VHVISFEATHDITPRGSATICADYNTVFELYGHDRCLFAPIPSATAALQVGFDAEQNTHAEIHFPSFQMVNIDGLHCREARLVNA